MLVGGVTFLLSPEVFIRSSKFGGSSWKVCAKILVVPFIYILCYPKKL